MQEIASRYLFVDMAIKNMQLDLKHIKNGPFKIKEPYIELIEKIISKAINERRKLKQMMHKQKIQVLYLHKQGDFISYKFILGGKEREVTFNKMVIKMNVEEIMREMLEGN